MRVFVKQDYPNKPSALCVWWLNDCLWPTATYCFFPKRFASVAWAASAAPSRSAEPAATRSLPKAVEAGPGADDDWKQF